MKSKRTAEISKVMYNSVLQFFNVERIYSDNAKGFRGHEWLSELYSLKIRMIDTAVNHPAGKGKVESTVKIVKTIFRKMLATNRDYNWTLLPLIVSKILNDSISPRTNFRPSEMLLGRDNAGANFMKMDLIIPPHSFIKSQQALINDKTQEIADMTAKAQEQIVQAKQVQNEKLNKKRINKTFKVGDYVFALDRTRFPGEKKAFKLKLNPSPWVVVRTLWTTTLCRRIADGYTCLFYNGHLKKFDRTSPLFQTLPVSVSKILLNKFQDLLSDDLRTITNNDMLTVPSGVELFTPQGVDENEENERENGGESSDEDEIDNPQPSTSAQSSNDPSLVRDKGKSPANKNTNSSAAKNPNYKKDKANEPENDNDSEESDNDNDKDNDDYLDELNDDIIELSSPNHENDDDENDENNQGSDDESVIVPSRRFNVHNNDDDDDDAGEGMLLRSGKRVRFTPR